MKEVFVVAVLLCIEGCASRPPVNCDWRLKPINAPAGKAQALDRSSKDKPFKPRAVEEKP
jgi:hypothetical protein